MSATTEATLWICESCGFIYDPAIGDPDGGIPPGTAVKAVKDGGAKLICFAPAAVYGEVILPIFGRRATFASIVCTLERTAGCLTVPVLVAMTMRSVSPETLGAACCRRLCAVALCVPESWLEAE